LEHVRQGSGSGGRAPAAGARSRRGCFIALALTVLAHPALAQKIYKWVDEKGVTQYTTTLPPGGKAQTIRPPSSGADPAPAAKSWQEQEVEFRARQVERAEAQHRQEQATNRDRYNAARKREACSNAHRSLQNLQQQRPVYSLDERGERQYLDDAQRAEAMRKSKAFIDQECPK
jgi:hypothetical protein